MSLHDAVEPVDSCITDQGCVVMQQDWATGALQIIRRPFRRLVTRRGNQDSVSGSEGTEKDRWTESLKNAVRPHVYRLLHSGGPNFTCPVCGYVGPFKDKRMPAAAGGLIRRHSKCVGCGSSERHRILSLVLDDVLGQWNPASRSLLHIAPDLALQPRLRRAFGTYHTADLFQAGVDFREDLQCLSFASASYDSILVSRVLMIPPDLESCIREMRRVLRPDGMAIVGEAWLCEHTQEYGGLRDGHSRRLGADSIRMLQQHFRDVTLFRAAQFDQRYQLMNRTYHGDQVVDDYPAITREVGVGYQELVAVCRP